MKENLDLKYENLRLVKSSNLLRPEDVDDARSKLAHKYKEIDDILCGLMSTSMSTSTSQQEPLVEETQAHTTCFNRQRSTSRLSDCIDEVSETSDTSSRPVSRRTVTSTKIMPELTALEEPSNSTESVEVVASAAEPLEVVGPAAAIDETSLTMKNKSPKARTSQPTNLECGVKSSRPKKSGPKTPNSDSKRPKKRIRDSIASPKVVLSDSPFALTPSPSQKPVKKSTVKKFKAASPQLSHQRQPLSIKSPNKLAIISPVKTKSPIKARRSRATQVNYALPSLRTKMRRPTEKLADAVTVVLDKEN